MKTLLTKITTTFRTAITSGVSPSKLALSTAVGLYVAFCPFIGFHFLLVLASSWLFSLNFPLTLAVTSINNPWTMIPFYSSGYAFGYYVLHGVFNINPAWTISLEKIFGSGSICVWSYILGGNVLGLLFSLMSYPMVKPLFRRLIETRQRVGEGGV